MEGSNIKPIKTEYADKISNTAYVNFRSIDPTDIFYYIFILLISLVIIRYLKFNIYLALIIVFAFIILDSSKKYVYKTVQKDNLRDKLNSIEPHPLYFDDYPDLIELFYGLKRIGELNFQAYSNAIYNTDAVIRLYKDVQIGVAECKFNYDVALDRTRDALNSLHSLVYSAETDSIVMKKLHLAFKVLRQILDAFLLKMRTTCNSSINKKGWNNQRHIIFPKPEPYNSSDELNYF